MGLGTGRACIGISLMSVFSFYHRCLPDCPQSKRHPVRATHAERIIPQHVEPISEAHLNAGLDRRKAPDPERHRIPRGSGFGGNHKHRKLNEEGPNSCSTEPEDDAYHIVLTGPAAGPIPRPSGTRTSRPGMLFVGPCLLFSSAGAVSDGKKQGTMT